MRLADVKNKILGEGDFRKTTRPKYKLIMVVPVKEQDMKEEEEDRGGELEARAKEVVKVSEEALQPGER